MFSLPVGGVVVSQTRLVDQLTVKQCEALEGVWQRLSSKEIGRKLDISPRSVDQRLDAARRTLGATDRNEAARLYAAAKAVPYPLTSEQFTVTPNVNPRVGEGRTSGSDHVFKEALTIKEQAPWENIEAWGVPEIRPNHLSQRARIVLIVAGAIGLVFLAGAVAGLYSLVEIALPH